MPWGVVAARGGAAKGGPRATAAVAAAEVEHRPRVGEVAGSASPQWISISIARVEEEVAAAAAAAAETVIEKTLRRSKE